MLPSRPKSGRKMLEHFMSEPLRAALRAKEAAAYLGIGISTLWRFAKEKPDFPKPRKIAPRCTAWMRADLDKFLESCANPELIR